MSCMEMDMLVHPYLDGELVAEERVPIEKHIHACPRCRDLLHHEVTFRQNLRTRLRPRADGLAPVALRQNVLAALDRADAKGQGPERPLLRRLAPAFGAMATAAAIALFFVLSQTAPIPGGEALVEQAISGHRKNLPVEIGGTDDEISRWFGGKVPVAVRPLRLEVGAPRVRLVGARLSHISSRDAGQIVYTVGRSQVTVYVFDPTGWDWAVSAPRHRRIDGRDVYFAEEAGYSVALYRDRGVGYAVATDLDEEHLLSLVQAALRE